MMSKQIDLQAFLASLPEVKTARLPHGTIFAANGLLYQVTETRAGDFRKARQWRRDENTEVALVPGSYLANFMPLVARGRLLPVFPTRQDLTEDGQSIVFLFPDEQQALDAAYLDVALVKSGGVYVRNHGTEPAFATTDGVQMFRIYYYSRTIHGQPVFIGADPARQTLKFRLSIKGPMHWRLLSSWTETTPWSDETRPSFSRVEPPLDDVTKTLPHNPFKRNPSEPTQRHDPVKDSD